MKSAPLSLFAAVIALLASAPAFAQSSTAGSSGGAASSGSSAGSTGGGTCPADQPVPCSTPDGQFCCARSQPYCCPSFACSADPVCGSGASTSGTSGTSTSGTSTSGSAGSSNGTSTGTTGTATTGGGTTGLSTTGLGSSTGRAGGSTSSGYVTQTQCTPAQPFACGAALCCDNSAPWCCGIGDGGLFCGADSVCGPPTGGTPNGGGNTVSCASTGGNGGLGLGACLLAVAGYAVLRSRRRR